MGDPFHGGKKRGSSVALLAKVAPRLLARLSVETPIYGLRVAAGALGLAVVATAAAQVGTRQHRNHHRLALARMTPVTRPGLSWAKPITTVRPHTCIARRPAARPSRDYLLSDI
jgi:hypothetical protein